MAQDTTKSKKPKKIEKSTVTIGRATIKTKMAYLDDKDKARIVAETIEITKLTVDDVDKNGKIIKKENK